MVEKEKETGMVKEMVMKEKEKDSKMRLTQTIITLHRRHSFISICINYFGSLCRVSFSILFFFPFLFLSFRTFFRNRSCIGFSIFGIKSNGNILFFFHVTTFVRTKSGEPSLPVNWKFGLSQ